MTILIATAGCGRGYFDDHPDTPAGIKCAHLLVTIGIATLATIPISIVRAKLRGRSGPRS